MRKRGRRANHQIAAIVPRLPRRAIGFFASFRPIGVRVVHCLAGHALKPAARRLCSPSGYRQEPRMSQSRAEDRLEVIATVVRCAAAFDDRDWTALNDVFTEDAIGYSVEGREGVVRFVRSFLGGCGPSQHLLGNHQVNIDGDRASSLCKARVIHVGAGDLSHLTYECLGNYWDDLVWTDAGWRIAARRFEVTITLGDSSVLRPG